MADTKRDVEVDILARDNTKRAVDSAANRFRRLKKQADDSNKALERIMKPAASAAKNLLKVAGGLAAVAATVGPATKGLILAGKATVAFGKALASVAPAAATLPAIAAGIALVAGTAAMAAPALVRAVNPVTAAFGRLQAQVGDLASRGVGQLSREFVRVNFPVIAASMRRIAIEQNKIVFGVGRWVNSANGQQAIRQITEATADAMTLLGPRIETVAIALGEMMRRVGGSPITRLSGWLGAAADQAGRLLGNVDKSEVDAALNKLSGWGIKLRDTFIVLRDIGGWMTANEGKVRAFSDAVATAALTIGVATGNIPAVLAGSFALAVNHWDELKREFRQAQPFFSNLWQGIKTDPGLRAVWDSVKSAWQGAVDSFRKGSADIGPKVQEMFRAWKRAWDEWAPLIKAWWDGIGKPVLSALGQFAALSMQIFVDRMTRAANVVNFLGDALKVMWHIVSGVFGNILTAATKAFGWMPVLGDKLRRASDEFEAFRDRVNNALSGIKDRNVMVKVATVSSVAGVSIGEGGTRPGGRGGAFDRLASWRPAQFAAAFAGNTNFAMGGSGGRIGGPVQVETTSQIEVNLDGKPFRQMTARAVADSERRQAWRARTGKR